MIINKTVMVTIQIFTFLFKEFRSLMSKPDVTMSRKKFPEKTCGGNLEINLSQKGSIHKTL